MLNRYYVVAMNKMTLVRALLYLLCFIEGAVLMANELLSSKIISVTFGSSLRSWSILLSVTLICLALGYYFGGKLASKRNRLKVILLVSMFLFLWQFTYLFISSGLTEPLLALPLVIGEVLFCLLSLGPIVCGLGILSPLFIALFANLSPDENGGVHAGRVYTVSTFGGVSATFLVGLYVLPALGTELTNQLLYLLLLVVVLILLGLFQVKALAH